MSNNNDQQQQEEKLKEICHSRYLHFWQTITKKQEQETKITLYDNIHVQGTILSLDSQTNRLCIKDLKTPTNGLYEKAVLRGVDIKTIEISHSDWHIGTRSTGVEKNFQAISSDI
ncbi:hypothetical protein BDA99DRAFT_524944 [Phascolomyces articulosus]|uniref:Uncharacterized protein n=1 Tax=Phascolomyces articulosus TaxID=60185 RepID=A0AAD5P953_9FUNG|nr:hypothetical protein BDA99DRAFT_524944 [Phascolomyces articulosus]